MTRNPIIRLFWLSAGLFFTGLAFVGVFLPLVPTTPFLLLAAFCFARSSERLNRWLHEHKWFGPFLTNWSRHGAIGKRAKYTAGVCLVAAPFLSYFLGAPLWTLAIQIPILIGSGTFIFTRPDGPPPVASPPETKD